MINRRCLVSLLFILAVWQIGSPSSSAINFLGQLQPDGLLSGSVFGGGGNSFERRVAVSGNLAAVGAGVFRRGKDQGQVFVYDFSDLQDIRQIAVLRPSDNESGNEFGDGVAVSGNYVFVGAWGDSTDTGAVYMYDVSDPDNIIERKLTAFDAAPRSSFGFSLATDGNRLIAGSPRFSSLSPRPPAAYVLDFTDPDNIQQVKVEQNLQYRGGNYGEAVDISGDYAIVGHISDSTEFPFGGSAHLYDLSNPNAIVEKRLTPNDAPNYNAFDKRVSISGTTAVVSVTSDPGPDNPPGVSEGAVWAFDFSDWNNVRQTEFGRSTFREEPDPFLSAPFGRFLDLVDGVSIAGAFNEGTGAVYFYDVSEVAAPSELFRLPGMPGDQRFGISFDYDGRTLIVSDQAGEVYLFSTVPEPAASALVAAFLLASGFFRLASRTGRF